MSERDEDRVDITVVFDVVQPDEPRVVLLLRN